MTAEQFSPDENEVGLYMHLSEEGFRDRFMELLIDRERNLKEIAKMIIVARYRLLECTLGTSLYRSRANTLRYIYIAYKADDEIDKDQLDALAATEDLDPFHPPDQTDEAFMDIALHFHTTDQR